MDPNVQVALIGIITTFITTVGVIGAAVIANYQRRATVAEKVVDEAIDDDELDTEDVMQRIFHLISENERKERMLGDARRQITELTNEVRQLRAENTFLRLGKSPSDPEDQPDL